MVCAQSAFLICLVITGLCVDSGKALDASLKRHTALIKRMRQSLGSEYRDQIIKDIDSLSLEKYVDEIVGAVAEGILRCKTEKDIWSAVEVRVLHPPRWSCIQSDAYMRMDRLYLPCTVGSPRHSRQPSSPPLPQQSHPLPVRHSPH